MTTVHIPPPTPFQTMSAAANRVAEAHQCKVTYTIIMPNGRSVAETVDRRPEAVKGIA